MAVITTDFPTSPRRTPAIRQFDGQAVLPGVIPLAALTLWYLSSLNGWLSPQILPAPAVVFQTFLELLQSGEIGTNLWISLKRVLAGFAVGGLLGVAFGVAMGLSKTAEQYLSPIFRALAQVPSLGWLPFLILLVGIGEPLKLIIIAKACFVPMALNSHDGIRNIPRAYLEVGRVFRLNRLTLLRRVVLPAIVPPLFSGVKLALSHAWIALVVVETFAATEGIGYLMVWGRTLFQIDVVLSGMVVVGAVGLAMDFGLRRIERRLRRWTPAV